MSLSNVDWDFARLEELIEARGDRVIHETGLACPCRNGDLYASTIEIENRPGSIRRSLGCTQCQGDGFIYRNAREIKGLLTSVDPGRNRTLIETGYAVPGDAIFSPSFHAGEMADFDRITTLNPEPVSEGQVIMRNAANLEDNATLNTGLSTDEDRLWYDAQCSFWCEDENGVVYTQNSDFVFNEKRIQWVGNTPTDGTLYTIKYNAYIEWILYATPFDRHDRNRTLAQKVLMRKKHVTFLNGSPEDTAVKRQAEQKEFVTTVKI